MGTDTDIEGRISFCYTIGEEYPYSGNICTEESVVQEVMDEIDEFGSYLDIEIYSYHSSWDWLMPVVKKIENMDIVKYSLISKRNYINGNEYYKVQLGIDTENNTDPANFPIEVMNSHSKIEAVWLAVVEFIKWYNGKQ